MEATQLKITIAITMLHSIRLFSKQLILFVFFQIDYHFKATRHYYYYYYTNNLKGLFFRVETYGSNTIKKNYCYYYVAFNSPLLQTTYFVCFFFKLIIILKQHAIIIIIQTI